MLSDGRHLRVLDYACYEHRGEASGVQARNIGATGFMVRVVAGEVVPKRLEISILRASVRSRSKGHGRLRVPLQTKQLAYFRIAVGKQVPGKTIGGRRAAVRRLAQPTRRVREDEHAALAYARGQRPVPEIGVDDHHAASR